jgi:uncharacterized protein YndB with AHSA1/START domain
MALKFQVQLKIQKPVAEVFDGVANPEKLSGYFVQYASGPLAQGTTVKWKFPEFPGEHDVVVREVIKNTVSTSVPAGPSDRHRRPRVGFRYYSVIAS